MNCHPLLPLNKALDVRKIQVTGPSILMHAVKTHNEGNGCDRKLIIVFFWLELAARKKLKKEGV